MVEHTNEFISKYTFCSNKSVTFGNAFNTEVTNRRLTTDEGTNGITSSFVCSSFVFRRPVECLHTYGLISDSIGLISTASGSCQGGVYDGHTEPRGQASGRSSSGKAPAPLRSRLCTLTCVTEYSGSDPTAPGHRCSIRSSSRRDIVAEQLQSGGFCPSRS